MLCPTCRAEMQPAPKLHDCEQCGTIVLDTGLVLSLEHISINAFADRSFQGTRAPGKHQRKDKAS